MQDEQFQNAYYGDIKAFRKAFPEEKIDIQKAKTLLAVCAKNGFAEITKAVCNKMGDLYPVELWGILSPSINLAAEFHHFEIFRFLISNAQFDNVRITTILYNLKS